MSVLAEAGNPGPPSIEVTGPVVLICIPTPRPVTCTPNVHEPPAPTTAPIGSELCRAAGVALTGPNGGYAPKT